MGLDQVKDLTQRTIGRILHGQPFHNLEDFLVRADPRLQEAANLARVGALEGFGTIPSILDRVCGGASSHKKTSVPWQAGQPSLFEWEQPEGGEDWSVAEKVAAQQELLGLSLEAHPLDLMADRIQAAGAITTIEAVGRIGQRVTVAGLHQSGHHSRTSRGESMMFLTLEDLSGTLDVVLFPDVYRRSKEIIHTSAPLLVTGVVEMDANRGEPLLRAERVLKVG